MPLSAADSITPAIEHTKQQLFKPFRIGQWTRLAFVGLIAGELGSNGCNRSTFQIPHHAPAGLNIPGSLGIDPALVAALVTSALIAAFAIGIILMYVGSVMRFILFDSVITRECRIREGWSRRLVPGWRYFVWKLLYALLTMVAIAELIGIPLAFVFFKGWFNDPKAHLAALILGGIILALAFFLLVIVTVLILVLTKDFVIPQMALEDIGLIEGWRRLWSMMKADKGAYATYILLKIVLAIVVGILIAVATLIVGVIFVVPTAGLSILAIITGKTAGLTWNAQTITLAVAIGCILLAIFLYVVSLISVPAIVFFPAYSIYFFADRYPRLAAALRSGSPLPQVSTGTISPPVLR